MTYDGYVTKVRARMARLRAAELFVKKHRAALAASFAALVFLVLLLLFFSGSFISPLKDYNGVYGDGYAGGARAFLSRVNCGYTENGEYHEGIPTLAGKYEVTASTENLFGIQRRQSAVVVIAKREARISLTDITVTYGDEPDTEKYVTAGGLADGDRLARADIEYDRYAPVSEARIENVRIENEKGEDVTPSYDIVTNTARATVMPRAITVATGSAEKKYDGEELVCRKYAVTDGSLAYGDKINAVFTASALTPSSVTNKAEITVVNNEEDVGRFYSISVSYGTLDVLPLQIRVKTGSAEKEYDGMPLSCREYEILYSELMDGHKIGAVRFPELTNTGSIRNEITFSVTDEDGLDVSSVYSVNGDYGTLTVRRRVVRYTSGSAEFEYDGTEHSCEKIVSVEAELYENDCATVMDFSRYKEAGEHDNTFKVIISGPTTPSTAYDIKLGYGKIIINKRPVTVQFRIYRGNDETHFTVTPKIIEGKLAAKESVYKPYVIKPDADAAEENALKAFKIVHGDLIVTDNYEITAVFDYDPEELHDFAEEIERSKAEETTQTEAPGTDTDTAPETLGASEKYGPSGIGSGGSGSGGIGGGIPNSPSPYSKLLQDAPEQSKEALGTVESMLSGSVYLRLRSFGDYTGSGWTEPKVYETDLQAKNPLNYTYSYLTSKAGYEATNELTVTYYVKDGLTPVPYYAQSKTSYNVYVVTDVAVPSDGKTETFHYNHVPRPSLQTMLSLDGGKRSFTYDYGQFVRETYLSVPDNVRAELEKIIAEAGLDASSPTVVTDVAAYVKGACKYSGAFGRIPDGEDGVLYFLTKSKEGVCGHFASAATLIYRVLGVPARYTVGYYVKTDGGLAQTEFYSKDAHAWVEIYKDSVGWIPVEVTSSAVADSGAGAELQPPDTKTDMFYNVLNFSVKPETKRYDGTPLYGTRINVLKGSNIEEGHTVSIKTAGITYAGTLYVTADEVTVTDADGRDVTEKYVFKQTGLAPLTVERRNVTLPDVTLYVGQTLDRPDKLVLDRETAELIGQDSVSFEFAPDDGLALGDDGTLTGISASDDRLFYSNFDLGTVEGPEDAGVDVVVWQKVTVLPFDNVRVCKGRPQNVSAGQSERVTAENGRIYEHLAVVSDSASKRFDGEYLSVGGYLIAGGALRQGDRLEYRPGASQLYAGSCDNIYGTLAVYDGAGFDVTGLYLIDFYPGTLTVLTGEYGADDGAVTVAVDGTVDLDGLVWTDRINGLRVTYSGGGPAVRVEDGVLIGITPGGSDVMALLHGADLNGDGLFEYSSSERTLRVTVEPKEQGTDKRTLAALLILTAAAASAATLAVVKAAHRRKKEDD